MSSRVASECSQGKTIPLHFLASYVTCTPGHQWLTPIILATSTGEAQEEDCELKASIGYIVSPNFKKNRKTTTNPNQNKTTLVISFRTQPDDTR
jgi:hypothetical protein